MKAVILASGVGTRLRPLTDTSPKILLDIGGTTILDLQVGALAACGIRDIVITTGHLKAQVEEYVRRTRDERFTFVFNPRYQETNYIYTFWLTRDAIGDDAVLLHGDLVFHKDLIGRLLEAEGSRVVVNPKVPSPEKDFKALIENDGVTRIGVDVSGPNAFFCAPLYKLAKADLLRWLARVEYYVKHGLVDRYAEDAFNDIAHEIDLRPLYSEDFCMEIDTAADLEEARRWVASRKTE